jgi:Txe/YoeB family toxin of Txe-Axe toxin-antitoxin module
LFLSAASWPEPTATAAGTRTNSLLQLFASSDLFTSVHFGCGANLPSSFDNDVSPNDVYWYHIHLNRGNEMKTLLNTINDVHGPIKAVVFDRFYTEEAFSFMVKEACPNALRILDMQDVHSLRIGRQNLVRDYDRRSIEQNPLTRKQLSSHLINSVMSFNPKDTFQGETDKFDKMKAKSHDTFVRELASIHRSDLVLVCSSDELKYLKLWNVPDWKMEVASFFCDNIDEKDLPVFDDRSDFVTVGG